MSALLAGRDPAISLSRACAALDVSRASLHRKARPQLARLPRTKPVSHRALSDDQRAAVLAVLHSPEHVDQPPREVYGALLAQDTYLCSVRTMYRLLAGCGESRERRDQRPAVHHAVPHLVANAPNQVWTWDITKLATLVTSVFLNLYMILDLFSRCIVGWMVATRETSALAQQLIARSIERTGVPAGQLILHNDRGAPMTAHSFDALLTILGIEASRSRPRVSNDNPFSEAGFKTLKYQPDFPGRFRDSHHARAWVRAFVSWYNERHCHEGLNGFTPHEVYSGDHVALAQARQLTLDAAHAKHPERWINGPPVLPRPPHTVFINPVPPVANDAIPPLPNELVPVDQPEFVKQRQSRSITT
jgi:putative transposase